MKFALSIERPFGSSGSDLDARLRLLEDESSIHRVIDVYCHAIDYGDSDLWADCFTEDGEYFAIMRDGQSRHVSGRLELRAYARANPSPPANYPKHMLSAPVINITGDEATAIGMFAVLNDSPNGPVVEVYGRYEAEMVRTADRRWRFRKRTATVEALVASYRLPLPSE